MPQPIIPSVSSEISHINADLKIHLEDELWVYYLDKHRIASHRADDIKMFHITTAQFIDSKLCRQTEIIETFKVSKISIARALKPFVKEDLRPFLWIKKGSVKKGQSLPLKCWHKLNSF